MKDANRSIFRADAVQRYRQSRQEYAQNHRCNRSQNFQTRHALSEGAARAVTQPSAVAIDRFEPAIYCKALISVTFN